MDNKPKKEQQLPGILIAIGAIIAFAIPGVGFFIVIPVIAYLYKKFAQNNKNIAIKPQAPNLSNGKQNRSFQITPESNIDTGSQSYSNGTPVSTPRSFNDLMKLLFATDLNQVRSVQNNSNIQPSSSSATPTQDSTHATEEIIRRPSQSLTEKYDNGTALTLEQLKSEEFKRRTKDIL